MTTIQLDFGEIGPAHAAANRAAGEETLAFLNASLDSRSTSVEPTAMGVGQ